MRKLALLLLLLPLAGCVSLAEKSAHLAMAETDCANTGGDNQAYLQCVNGYLASHYGWQEQAVQEPGTGALYIPTMHYLGAPTSPAGGIGGEDNYSH